MALGAIAGAIKNRLETPVLGNYFLSLLLLNWKIPTALITGNINPSERMVLVEAYMDSCWYKWSFLLALVMTLFYLYLLPVIELVIKWFQIQISIFVSQKNNALDSRLLSQHKYGGDVDSIGAALKTQLTITNKILSEFSETVKNENFSSTSDLLLNNFSSKKKEAEATVKENIEILNNLRGIFDKLDLSKPVDVVKTSFQNRDNQRKARRK